MKKKIENCTAKYISNMRDTLYNASVDCTTDKEKIDYGRGIIVGVVSSILADGKFTFSDAVKHVCELIRICNFQEYGNHRLNQDCIPASWMDEFLKQDREVF